MKAQKEVKISIIVTFLMLVTCGIIILINETKKNNKKVDLKVYKLMEPENEQKYYHECIITTEEMIAINKDIKRTKSLNSKNSIKGRINGNYKIIVNNKTYAFDDESNIIYVGDQQALYNFKSNMYKTIINRCNQ